MENQFVTYEIALKLKELGFDEPCFFAFDNCKFRCKDLRTNEQEFEGVNYNSSTYISQPLWQQVIDWLREKHNVDIFPTLTTTIPDYKGGDILYTYSICTKFDDGTPCWTYDIDIVFDTYEEAREQAIIKAIEMLCKKNL